MNDFYGHNLAQAHSEGFAGRIDEASDWLAGLAGQADGAPFVFDIGCGDGRMLRALSRRGVPGCGIDISPAFVARAREQGLDVREASASEAEFPQATLVTALGEVVCYQDAAGGTCLAAVARKAFAALAPGGALVLDVIGQDTPASAGWHDGGDWFVAAEAHLHARRLTRRIVTFARTGTAWRRSDESHVQHILDAAEVSAALGEAGFRVGRIERLGDAALLPGRLGFLARKPR